jgi:hypothetical protein
MTFFKIQELEFAVNLNPGIYAKTYERHLILWNLHKDRERR